MCLKPERECVCVFGLQIPSVVIAGRGGGGGTENDLLLEQDCLRITVCD